MRHLSRASCCFALTIAGGLAAFGPSVRGSSVGVREHHAHQLQVNQSLVHSLVTLPSFSQPVPLHVPALSNSALLRLWEHHPGSAILRDPGIEKQLCMAVSATRDVNPTRFDHFHPVLGHLIRDTNYFNFVLGAYLSHPSRFTVYHPLLVPFIRGCALMTETPTTPPATGTGQTETPGSSTTTPIAEGISQGPTPPPEGTGGVTTPQAVPAPPSFVLLLFGMSIVATRLRGRRSLSPTT